MQTVRITNDTALNGIASVKMECECGWVEKAYQHKGEQIAMQHLKMRHSKGVVHIDGVRYEVTRL